MPGSPVPDNGAPAGPAPEQTGAASPEARIEALQAQLAEAESKAGAARDAQLRAIAELDNVRKRAEREIASAGKYAAEKLLGELLGVADSLDLGLTAALKPDAQMESLVSGMQLTLKQLLAVMEKFGVSQLDPGGEPFNPDFHEAVSMLPSADVAPNHVLSVMQKGYRHHERLLRPAMVVVARAPDSAG